jgi:hypothetical protein
MRKVKLTQYGIEEIEYYRDLIVEVPDDVTDDEIEGMESHEFDDVDPDLPSSNWEADGGTGIWGRGNHTVDLTDENVSASDAADCRIVRDGLGNLLVEISEVQS